MKTILSGSLLLLLALLTGCATTPSSGQKVFPTGEAAADSFIATVKSHDNAAYEEILGRDWKKLLPADGVDPKDVETFLNEAAQSHSIVTNDAGKVLLSVGTGGWTLPIPLVHDTDGWRFDTKAGEEEIRTRRIGRDELAVIQAALAYCDAQREYAQADHDGDNVPEYAQRLLSSPGKHDGLYWSTAEGEPESPLGPLLAEHKAGTAYHGYRYRILTSQGANARGGTRDYIIGGRLTGGFALVAWPATYDDTGVMTFVVNHEGQVYQKDLGKDTASAVRKIKSFDPDTSWHKVTAEK